MPSLPLSRRRVFLAQIQDALEEGDGLLDMRVLILPR